MTDEELIFNIDNEYSNFCIGRDCRDCKYEDCRECKIAFVVDNYNLEKKPNKELEEITELYEKYSKEFYEYCHERMCGDCVLHTKKGCCGCVSRFIMAKERGIL